MISDSDYKAIVKEVLDNQEKLSPDCNRILKKSIRDNIPVKGYKNPFKAPNPLLIQAIEKVSSWNNPLLAILEAWSVLHDDLEKEASRFLDSFTLPKAEIVVDQEEPTADIWSEEIFNKAVEGFWKQHPRFEKKRLRSCSVC